VRVGPTAEVADAARKVSDCVALEVLRFAHYDAPSDGVVGTLYYDASSTCARSARATLKRLRSQVLLVVCPGPLPGKRWVTCGGYVQSGPATGRRCGLACPWTPAVLPAS
jgi:hypothetical protein